MTWRGFTIRLTFALLVTAFALLLMLAVGSEETEGAKTIDCQYKGNYGGEFWDVAHDGEYLYATTGQGMSIFDVSDPTNPERIGIIQTGFGGRAVTVAGDHAYVMAYDHDSEDEWTTNLMILDVKDKTGPHEVGRYTNSGWAVDIAVVGDYA